MNIKFIKKFVEESDAIERIYHKGVSQYLHDHMSTAMHVINAAQEGRLVHPLEIHRSLMRESLGAEAGEYRTVGVMVGNFFPINSVTVPHAFELWNNYVNIILEERDNLSEAEKMKYSWKSHKYFEQIHGFIDGNGRTGRLSLLGLRLILGLKPMIIYESEKENYYRMLERFQQGIDRD